MIGFEYATTPHARRHGPAGYEDYNSYRDWFRDEFIFRCVYCLYREQWNYRGAAFHVDHFVPVVADPTGEFEYSNLLYACARCNEAKRAVLGLPDPCEIAFHDCLRIMADGRIEALNNEGKKLNLVLRLDSEKSVRNRSLWIRTLEFLRTTNTALYQEYMGFPADLPDLRKKRVRQNTKPDGAANCYFVLRERGELQAIY
jgi:HNH endonuclease